MNWETLAAVAGLFTLWTGLNLWATKWLLDRYTAHMDQRFVSMDTKLNEFNERMHAAEREHLVCKTDCVRREDWIRSWTGADHKLESLRTVITSLQLAMEAFRGQLEAYRGHHDERG